MVFVLFTLPALLAGGGLALSVGNSVLDRVYAVRDVRKVQKECGKKDPVHVSVDVVMSQEDAEELLRNPKVAAGRAAADAFVKTGVLRPCGRCGRPHG
jgi:hypothetical protein